MVKGYDFETGKFIGKFNDVNLYPSDKISKYSIKICVEHITL